ncbi:lipocalin family protein [Spongiibacter taiwanensis]|uniref:lipocalin family protein n=1 Tax=Spongiibacter taiwanensis TaxID=1748242 RepID=UPI002035AA9F|nr:lipocalin family protein [Spongiibacter taiwanensis]USA44438.1 lipocalin family protein [Spongiibacter taiwanensis]
MFPAKIFLLLSLALLGCSAREPLPPLPLAENVDLQRFMGPWYVIGFIPLFPERHANNGIERYKLMDDGRIAVAYRFREGSAEGELKSYFPSAEVVPGTGNAVWRMQFLWPFTADFRIAYLADDYQEVIIGREARDYVWLMARSPDMSAERFEALRRRIGQMGYDVESLRRQPQVWPEKSQRPPLEGW